MAINQKIERKRVLNLPTSNLIAGSNYELFLGGGVYRNYVVNDSLQLVAQDGKEFIECDTVAELRDLDSRQIWAIQNGYYKGVKLNGYYTKGDTPAPIEYYLSDTVEPEDGGSVFEVGGIKLEHRFNFSTDVLYWGAKGDESEDSSLYIQKAIDYIESLGGGDIVLSSGTYIFTEIHNGNNCRLISIGAILKLKDGHCIDETKSYYLVHNLNKNNSIFENLLIDGNQQNNTNFLVADGITCVGINSKVINCKVINPPDSGIMFSSTEGGVCDSNMVKGAPDCGIYVNATNTSISDGTTVRNNKVYDCVVTGIALKRECKGVLVSDNYIYNAGSGITVENFTTDGQGYPKDCKIVNNYIKKIGYLFPSGAKRGISISRSENLLVTGNTVIDCEGYALFMASSYNANVNSNNFNTNDSLNESVHIVSVESIENNGFFNKNVLNKPVLYPISSTNNVNINDNIVLNQIGLVKLGYRSISAGTLMPSTSIGVRFVGERAVWLFDNSIWVATDKTTNTWARETAINATVNFKGLVNQSTAVGDVTTADATDDIEAIALVNELKAKINAMLVSDRASGQRAT